jgi:outer membrane protein OmpA-like peptidoglycan-associated protein
MIYEIGRLNDELVKAQKKIDAAEAKAAEAKVVEMQPTATADVAMVRDRYVEMTRVVTFPQNSYELTKDAMEILDNVSGNVNIYAYASPEGSKEYNLELSQKRADAVAEYLKAKGVTVESAKGMGVVGIASNRIAIVHNINSEN